MPLPTERPFDLTLRPLPVDGRPRQRQLPAPVVFPPEVYPPANATLFRASVNGTVSVSNAAPITVCTLNAIPKQSMGVIRHIGWGVNGMTATSVISWSLRYNQGGVQYGPLTISPSRAAVFTGDETPQDFLMRIPLGVIVIDLVATVGAADGATYTVGGSFEGWYWPVDQIAGA